MKKRIRIILIIAIVLFIAGMALYPVIKNKILAKNSEKQTETAGSKSGGDRNKPLNINAQILKYETMTDVFRTKGILIPDEEVNLSFETSGKITNIYFKEGSIVKKGELLAKINDKALQAELEKLNTQVPLAQDRVFRQKSLLEKEAVSQEAYDQVITELDKLQADIKLIKVRIAETELRAPFDGVVGLRQVSEGTYATPSTVIATLTKTSPLKLEFSVNEKHANDVKPGKGIDFTLDNDLQHYQATIYAVESSLDLQTLALKVRARYANPGGKLKPGRSANIEIKLQEIKNALVVPSQAIIAEMGRDIAFIYKNGKAQQITLQKGLRTESAVQVLDGLQPGDTLITTGVMQLRDGMSVTIDNIR